jgi:hypothetical protein
MWMWILGSLAVVAILAVIAAVVFINAVGSAYNIFSAPGTRPSLFRWPENLWPRKAVFRFPLPASCIAAADRGKPPPDLTLAEIAEAVKPFYARAEALYAAHKRPKPEHSEEYLAEARSLRVKAVEHRKRGEEGKAGEQTSAWGSYAEACEYYEMVVRDLTASPPK